ncbi:MAG: histidine--tRNA ligase [Cyclobacteriaceae bacterium]|nr:histidine--tRNA ligase [Cyclobacteriaceae bacterium]
MSSIQLGVPKGTRDFGPQTMAKRQFILDHIRRIFEKYGFQPLETPSMEQLSVLTGKYGEEGDQLLFKILNSGDFLKKTQPQDFEGGSKHLLDKISQKGLRYDLTVPFARYVVMHRHEITFPFKRYQMQPVWRADRPQRGRYREFMQCDADVVGTDSLLCEAEIVAMINEVFQQLGINDFTILVNHRKILGGMAEAIGAAGREAELAVSLDKFQKIGADKMAQELSQKGFAQGSIDQLLSMTSWKGDWSEIKQVLTKGIGSNAGTSEGIADLDNMLLLVQELGLSNANLQFDASLARGLSYYTGTIFEVVVNNATMGSVSGGGRYDDLTGVFGLPDVSGVGISFGVDRLYDVMEQLDLFPSDQLQFTKVLLVSLDEESMGSALELLGSLRNEGISSELYPDRAKLKKPLAYANKKNIPWVVLIGSEETEQGVISVKDMGAGTQSQMTPDQFLAHMN